MSCSSADGRQAMNKSKTCDSRPVIDSDSRGTVGSDHLWGAAAEIMRADEALEP